MCIGYELNGKIDYLPAASEDQFKIKPVYKTFKDGKLKWYKNMKDLPENAKKYIYALEDFIGAKVSNFYKSWRGYRYNGSF